VEGAKREPDDDEGEHEDASFSSGSSDDSPASDEDHGPDLIIGTGDILLPGRLDPITYTEMRRPALSPYGHVCDYDTWVRCLQADPTCPFTKQPLNKRELIMLNLENINHYKRRIVK